LAWNVSPLQRELEAQIKKNYFWFQDEDRHLQITKITGKNIITQQRTAASWHTCNKADYSKDLDFDECSWVSTEAHDSHRASSPAYWTTKT